jgi:predicted phosphoribosyltransferase
MSQALMTQFDFVDRADAGQKMLATFKPEILAHDVIVVVLPAAVEIALAFATEMTLPMRDLNIIRTRTEVSIPRIGDLAGLNVAVIDDGVESGSTAMAIGAMLRDAAVNSATLIVPVCPKSVVPYLLAVYDTIHAVVSPPAPTPLALYYETN